MDEKQNQESVTIADVLPILETISEQQAAISMQLADLLEELRKPPETSLIDELAALLQPLAGDLADIRSSIGQITNSGRESAMAGRPTT